MSTERWTYEQAGAHRDMSASTYRSYTVRQGAPTADQFDPDTGRKTVAADLVRAWWSARPGRGARTDLRRALESTRG